MNQLLVPASSFIESLTRLPLVATLLAELLPTMDVNELPKTRWELFNTLLVRGLLRRDLPGMEAELVANDFRQLPPERQEALLILSDLALDGLLQTPPKLVFRYADIVAKCVGNSATTVEELMEVVKSVMVSYREMDEMQEEVTLYHFVHLSFHEFFAAMALKYPTSMSAEMYGVSRLAYSAKTLTIGERFDNFWLFAAGFFKTEPVVFFKALFSAVNINMMRSTEDRQAIQDMLFQMLQEMIPDVSDFIRKKHSVALEQVAVFLNRKVSNLHDFSYLRPTGRHLFGLGNLTAAYYHALRLLPGLTTVEVDYNSRVRVRLKLADLLRALQSKHQLQALFFGTKHHFPFSDEEMQSLTSILQTASLKRLQLPGFALSAKQLKSLAGELSRMNHSLRHLWLRSDGDGNGNALAMQSLSSALSKHHSSLIDLEISHPLLDSEDTIKPLASLLVNLKKLQQLGVRSCPISTRTLELLSSAVRASTSLTSLKVTIDKFFIDWNKTCSFDISEHQRREQSRQLMYLAVNHPSITRFETAYTFLGECEVMDIVKEVLKTKGKPHQLTQLDLYFSFRLLHGGADRARSLIQREHLNLTIAIEFLDRPWDKFKYGGGIVTNLPRWLPHDK